MSKATIERKAQEIMEMLQKEPSKKPSLPPQKGQQLLAEKIPAKEKVVGKGKSRTTPDTTVNSQNQIQQLALQTFQVFGISPSKVDLDALMQNIRRISQERSLSLTVMLKNLKTYDAFVNTQGVTTNYSLRNWLSGDGNGYGKNWEKWLQKAKKNLLESLSKEAADKAVQSASLNYSNYKGSKRPSFYPEIKPKTNSNT